MPPEGWNSDLPTRLDLKFTPIGGEGASLGESPFWDHGDTIWWVDIEGRKLLCTGISARETLIWPTPETPGFVVLTATGRPAVGMETGIFAFSPADGRFERLVAFDRTGERFNDATVDSTGRLWASTMATDAAPGRGAIHAVTAELSLRTVLDGLTTPNGLAADVAGGRLFVSDSHPDVQAIWTAVCNFRTGEIGDRSPFASMRELPGRPDGAAFVAASGHYWIAAVDGGALMGYASDGTVEFAAPLAFPAPTKLAFFAGGVAVTAKGTGGHDGCLALATGVPAILRGDAVPFWKPGGRGLAH